MLITLGGAARAGKGIISGKLVHKTAIPLLALDVLKMGLHHGGSGPGRGEHPIQSVSLRGVRPLGFQVFRLLDGFRGEG